MNIDGSKTILLVEDEAIISLITSKTLERHGYKVLTVNSGERAVELAVTVDTIHLVLMDINLGDGIDGTETARNILAVRNLPIVFHTSHSEREMVEKVKGITRYGYIIKSSGDFVLNSSIEMAFELFEANRQIVESELKQKALISNISDVIGIIDADGILKYESPNIEKWFGWRPDDLVGTDGWLIIHPDDTVRLRNDFSELLQENGSTRTVECKFKCKDGSYKPIELSARNLINDPVIRGVLVNYHDISDRKQTEERLHLALLMAHMGYWKYEPETGILHEYEEHGTMFNIPSGKRVRTLADVQPLIHPDDLDCARDSLYKTVVEGIPFDCTYRTVPPGGEIRWLHSIGYLRRKPSGEPDYVFGITQDITGYRRIDDKLVKSEQKYRSLFDGMTEGFALHEIIYDESGRPCDYRFLDANPAFERLTGLKRKDILGKSQRQVMSDEDPFWLEIYSKVAVTGEPVHAEHFSPALQRHFGVFSYSPSSGQFAVIFSDITGRKLAEERMVQTWQQLKIITDNIPVSVAYVDSHELRYKFVNRVFAGTFGMVPEEMTGREVREILGVEAYGRAFPFIKRAASGERVDYENLIPINNENRWFSLNYIPEIDEEGIVRNIIVLAFDITDRKNAEDAVRQSGEQFKNLVWDMQVGVLLQGPKAEIIMSNPKALELLGLTEGQLLGKTSFDPDWNVIHEDGSPFLGPDHPVPRSIASGLPVRKTIMGVYRPVPGDRIWLLVDAEPHFSDDRVLHHVVCTFIDISDWKNAEEKIKSLLAEKEIILKEVHHRIKNNMNTIISLLSLQAGTMDEPSACTALEDAGSRIRSMMILYDKLYQAQNFKDVDVKTYISSLADEIVDNFPNSKSVRVEKSLDDFQLDVKKLQSLGIIVNELLTNIMKYAFSGRDDGLIEISAFSKNNTVTIIIRDNGGGIQENVDFENSTGFGLMLVKMLTEQLGGMIRLERENGTKFTLEFRQ